MEMPSWPWSKEEKEPTSKDGEEGLTEEEKEAQRKLESSSSPPQTDTGVQSPFNVDGPLAGKTEKEISDLLAIQDMTIKEHAAVPLAPTQAAPEPEPEPVIATSEEFFANPGKVMNDAISAGIQSQMKEIVSELRSDMGSRKIKTAWEEAAESIPNLSSMRPLIEAKLKQSGITTPNIASIIGVNDMLLGQAQREGQALPEMETKAGSAPIAENTRMIPQHNVSTQPLSSTTKKVEYEPLDENEARMAREKKMTPEMFRQWQAIDGEDVLRPAAEKAS